MSEAPAWLPQAAAQHWRDDGLKLPATGTLDLGGVPDGEVVHLQPRQQGTLHVEASSIGRGARLVVHGAHRITVIVLADFRVVDVHPAGNFHLELRNYANVHVVAPGTLQLTGPADSPLRLWVDDVDGDVSVTARTPLGHLKGTAAKVTLHPLSDSEPVLVESASVALDGDLETPRAVLSIGSSEGPARVSGVLTCAALAKGASVEVTALQLDAQPLGRQEAVGAGASITVGTSLAVKGAVNGSSDDPVGVLLRPGAAATFAGHVAHTTIEAASGDGPAGEVKLQSTAHTTVVGVTSISSAGNGGHESPSFSAAGSIDLAGPCGGELRLDSCAVTLNGTTTAFGTIDGQRVALGTTEPHGDGRLLVRPTESLHTGCPVTLDIAVPPGGPPVPVSVGAQNLPSVDIDLSDDDAFHGVVRSNAGSRRSDLSIHGPVVLACGKQALLRDLVGLVALMVGEGVELAGEAEIPMVDVAEARVAGDVEMSGRGWTGDCLRADGEVRAGASLEVRRHLQARAVRDTTGTVGRLSVASDVENCDLEVTGEATVEGQVLHPEAARSPETVRLEVRGTATIEGAVEPALELHAGANLGGSVGHVRWRPSRGDSLTLAAPAERLAVQPTDTSPDHPAELELGTDGHVGTLHVVGHLAVSATKPDKRQLAGSAKGVDHLDLDEDACVTLGLARESDESVQVALHSRAARLVSTTGRVAIRTETLTPKGALELSGAFAVNGPAQADEVEKQPNLQLDGANLVLHGQFPSIVARHAGQTSEIEVAADATVHSLHGPVVLKALAGRVTGATRSTWRTGRRSMPAPAVAVRVEDSMTGVLIGVDVSGLTLPELKTLDTLEVFSPAPGPLRALARSGNTPAEKQENAQKLATIAAEVEGRAISGSVRTRADWAVARAHHRIAPRPEWAARWLSRAVGYSHRPMPALLTVVLVVAALTVGLSEWESGTCEILDQGQVEKVELADYSAGENAQRLLGPTLTFLRLSPGGAELAPVGCSPTLQVAATLLVLLPLLFFVIAVRHYMSDPAER